MVCVLISSSLNSLPLPLPVQTLAGFLGGEQEEGCLSGLVLISSFLLKFSVYSKEKEETKVSFYTTPAAYNYQNTAPSAPPMIPSVSGAAGKWPVTTPWDLGSLKTHIHAEVLLKMLFPT